MSATIPDGDERIILSMKKYSTVADYLADLEEDKLRQVELLRSTIFRIEPTFEERIKWNAPSYALNDDDRITFGMNKAGITTLVLHMGATRKEDKKAQPILTDDHGLVEWKSDIRGLMTFESSQEITEHQSDIADVLKRWLAL